MNGAMRRFLEGSTRRLAFCEDRRWLLNINFVCESRGGLRFIFTPMSTIPFAEMRSCDSSK